mmetsp:Transcript_139158/g.388236  ORF Transcript_139158/g.388236 Transcript_139158/m.388236 type:complete len:283 (+) Transcript_139158:129-977(+)
MCADGMGVRRSQAEEEAAESELVVRNTFLSFGMPRPTPPRSTSVPASARLAGQACTDMDASERERKALDAIEPFVATGGSSQSPVQATKAVAPQRASRILTLEEMLPDKPSYLPFALPGPIPTRLNAHARAWTPGEAPAQALVNTRFRWQVRAVARVATMALADDQCVLSTDIAEGTQDWTVVAYVRPQDLGTRREHLLSLAKEALLQGSKGSQNVYILGHRWRPFADTPLGFCARLAEVPNPSQACWGLLGKGVCSAGGRCRWEHPATQTNLNVMVKIQEF